MATSKFDYLVSGVYTMHDLEEKLQFLKNYLKIQIFGDKDTKNFSSEDLTWLATLPPDFIKDINKDNMDQIFADLEKETKNLKALVMFIPTDFPHATIKDLSLKLRKDYGPRFLIDLKNDPNLIAGCALVWNGIYKDYSLRAKINESREDILLILKKWK